MSKPTETIVLYKRGSLAFEIYADSARKWRWRAKSRNHQIVATSGESFASRRNATRAAERFIAWVQESEAC